MMSIADNLNRVRERVENAVSLAQRPAGDCRLLAVSKTRSADEIRSLAELGQLDFGENYLQEALDKMSELADLPLQWHFIGPIQSNKTRSIAESFSWVHSVDRLKIARRLSEQRPDNLPPLNVCLQINIDDEDSKSGCSVEEAAQLAEEICQLERVVLRGLMAIPDPEQSDEAIASSFQRLADLLEQLKATLPCGQSLDTLSMGMSGDLDSAIAAGSTCVRVGTAIFGERPAKTES